MTLCQRYAVAVLLGITSPIWLTLLVCFLLTCVVFGIIALLTAE